MKKLFKRLSLILVLASSLSFSQNKEISGTVKDNLGLPLPGVSIVIKGTIKGTSTDFDGKFSINANSSQTLVFSYVGFKTKEIKIVESKNSYNISLEEDAAQLDEVVVVGYGTQKKSDVTGAVASLDTEIIETYPVTTVGQALQGRLAGVSIAANGGGAEGTTSIQVRGQNSLTASNSPLIILDGIPFSGNISSINPNDIGSIEVLKDASSAAIYGARASNGVILITTKKGKTGKPTINYSTNYQFSNVTNLPDFMDGDTFYDRKLEFFNNENPTATIEQIFTPTELEVYQSGTYANWADEALRSGTRKEHNLSISGGTKNLSYFLSGAVVQTEGVAKGDDFDRYSVRFNVENDINDWLKIGTNTLLSLADNSGNPVNFSYGSNDVYTLRMNPLTRVRQDDGSLTIYPWPENVFYGNPLEPLNYSNESTTTSINTNNYLEIKLPIEGLKYRINTGYNTREGKFDVYRDINTKTGLENGGRATSQTSSTVDWIVENILSYQKSFGKHNVFLTALYSSQKNINKFRQIRGRGFPNDIRTTYQMESAEILEIDDNYTERSFLSQMFRANYGYDSRYQLTYTIRRDGYSGFGSENKFGVFPSVALAWNLMNEPFMPESDVVNRIKIRASYGKNGNQAVSPFSTLTRLSTQDYLNADRSTAFGFYPGGLGDPTLGWEESLTTNLGIDFGLFKGRIQGSIDYFDTQTTDLLLNRTISPINGDTRILQNVGETATSGFEFQVSSVNINKNDFKWSTDFNFSLYRTKIVDVGIVDDLGNIDDDVASRWFIGEPVDVFFGHVYDGIWQTGDDIANSAQPTALPGDVRVKDVNGDGAIDEDDRAIQGNKQPDFSAGINNTISYKNFTLNFFINTVQGFELSNPLWGTFYNNYDSNVYNYDFWSPTNPTNDYPANRTGTNPFSAKPRGKGSFIRLKDITLSYDLTKELIPNLPFETLQIFVNAKNVATWTDYEFGWDPEFDSDNAIPLNRSFMLGVRVGL
jgi:TonB-linked SusC/RagA family outer membrane protein